MTTEQQLRETFERQFRDEYNLVRSATSPDEYAFSPARAAWKGYKAALALPAGQDDVPLSKFKVRREGNNAVITTPAGEIVMSLMGPNDKGVVDEETLDFEKDL